MRPNANTRKLLLLGVLDRLRQFVERELTRRQYILIWILMQRSTQKLDCILQMSTLIVVNADECETLAHDLFARQIQLGIRMHHADQHVSTAGFEQMHAAHERVRVAARFDYAIELVQLGLELKCFFILAFQYKFIFKVYVTKFLCCYN